jgi:hypothetical protein
MSLSRSIRTNWFNYFRMNRRFYSNGNKNVAFEITSAASRVSTAEGSNCCLFSRSKLPRAGCASE